MQKNKILNKIFKRLIKFNYESHDIKNFLSIEKDFNKFENFIFYLWTISTKNYQDLKFMMAKSISSYLEYLVTHYEIENFTIDTLKVNQNLSLYEIYLLGAKGFDGNIPFSFDIEDNCYISLNEHPYEEYKNIINIALCFHNKSFLNSLVNQRILSNNFNKIFIFKKNITNYQFMGSYKIKDLSQVYENENAFVSLILIKHDYDEDDIYLEYLNLNNRNYFLSLESLRHSANNIVIKNKKDANNFLKLIDDSNSHYLLIYNLINHALIINDLNLLTDIAIKFKLMLKQDLMLALIIPNQTQIDEFYLSLFANTYDILYGMQINADFLNNIYIVLDHKNFENQDYNNINIRFVKSYGKYFFDLNINKKIFSTITENSCIYLFVKHDQKIIYHGLYKVSKLVIGVDLDANKTPIFVIRPLTCNEKQKHLIYLHENHSINNYKNAFCNFAKDDFKYMHWFKDTESIKPIKTDKKNELLNTNLYKYNWVINQCIFNLTSDVFYKYNDLFVKLTNKHLFNVLNCINFKYEYIINNKLMQPWTIAYQMTKQNYLNKKLFDIAYVDFYETKEAKYLSCLAALHKDDVIS